MYYELTGDCVALNLEETEAIDATAYEQMIKGKTFEDTDAMDKFMDDFASTNNILWDSYSFREVTTDEEDEEEWNETISAAMAESERTGQPFDHIMGEVLGGVR